MVRATVKHADHHYYLAHAGERISNFFHKPLAWSLLAVVALALVMILYAAWAEATSPANTMDFGNYYFRW